MLKAKTLYKGSDTLAIVRTMLLWLEPIALERLLYAQGQWRASRSLWTA